MAEKLSLKQRAFINEYLKDFNATAAAERAGYRGKRATLAVVGSENLKKPKIQAIIEEAMAEEAMRAEEVVQRLSRQARGSMADFVIKGEDGVYRIDLDKAMENGVMDLVERLVIRETVGEDNQVRRWVNLKLYNAQKALTLLGKGYGLWGGSGHRPEQEETKKKTNMDDDKDFISAIHEFNEMVFGDVRGLDAYKKALAYGIVEAPYKGDRVWREKYGNKIWDMDIEEYYEKLLKVGKWEIETFYTTSSTESEWNPDGLMDDPRSDKEKAYAEAVEYGFIEGPMEALPEAGEEYVDP